MYDDGSYEPSESPSSCDQQSVNSHGNSIVTFKTTDTQKAKKNENRSGLHVITRIINGKKTKINLFNTEIRINAKIVNAVTGMLYVNNRNQHYKVGTELEDLLFKVRLVTRENGIPGITLFYDDPEQYERHLGVIVEQSLKLNYEQKEKEMRKRYAKFLIS